MTKKDSKKPSICIVTCYRQPDYIRAATLRQGLKDSKFFSRVIIIKNKHSNVRRYFEVLVDLLKVRFTQNPDAYLITFRGYELLPLILIIGFGKKIIYDEFINPVEWFVYEHKHFVGRLSFLGGILRVTYSAMMKKTKAIIADTASHAAYSSELMSVDLDKYFTIPVGSDESMFKPLTAPSKRSDRPFCVLYYGSMLPLHGIDYVLEAAIQLASNKDIEFYIIGGKQKLVEKVVEAQARGANIRYESWVSYQRIPQIVADCDLGLGGPFGDTIQSQYVVTGKTYQFLASSRAAVIGLNRETKFFTDKHDALVVAQADTSALVKVIKWAYLHQAELQQIAKNGRKLYERSFSSKRIASDLSRLMTTKHIF